MNIEASGGKEQKWEKKLHIFVLAVFFETNMKYKIKCVIEPKRSMPISFLRSIRFAL